MDVPARESKANGAMEKAVRMGRPVQDAQVALGVRDEDRAAVAPPRPPVDGLVGHRDLHALRREAPRSNGF